MGVYSSVAELLLCLAWVQSSALQRGGGSTTGREREGEGGSGCNVESPLLLIHPIHHVKPIKEQRKKWGWHLAVATVWSAKLYNYYRDPREAGTGLRSKGKITNFSASCAAFLTSIHTMSSHVYPERVNSGSSAAASGRHTVLDLVRTPACKHLFLKNNSHCPFEPPI